MQKRGITPLTSSIFSPSSFSLQPMDPFATAVPVWVYRGRGLPTHSAATTDHDSAVKESSSWSLMLSGSTRTLSPMLSLPRLNTRNTTYTVLRLPLSWLELCCIYMTS